MLSVEAGKLLRKEHENNKPEIQWGEAESE